VKTLIALLGRRRISEMLSALRGTPMREPCDLR
jgi:hypothetical protein